MAEMATYSGRAERQGATDQLSEEISRTSELLDRLDSVLTPALRPPSPMAMQDDKMADMSSLRDSVFRLADLNSRLSNLLERVDL